MIAVKAEVLLPFRIPVKVPTPVPPILTSSNPVVKNAVALSPDAAILPLAVPGCQTPLAVLHTRACPSVALA